MFPFVSRARSARACRQALSRSGMLPTNAKRVRDRADDDFVKANERKVCRQQQSSCGDSDQQHSRADRVKSTRESLRYH